MTRWPKNLCLFVLLAMSFAGTHPDARPNVLVVIADDWSWLHSGAYGDTVVATPVLDRIAREGVRFEHAYVSSPSCTPSRAAMLTGQHFWRLAGGANLYGPLSSEHVTYVDLMEGSGYHAGFTRKGWGPGQLGQRRRNPAGDRYASFAEFLAARNGSEPFVFWFGTHDPHRPFDTGSGAESGMDLSAIQLPEVFPDHTSVRADVADYFMEVQRIDQDMARLVAQLDSIGELDHTLLVITSDNGMAFPRAKGSVYDLGTRVPLIMRLPGDIHSARVVTDLISLTDLAPTILEWAGIAPPRAMTGRSLMSILTSEAAGFVDSTRSSVFFGRERHVPAQESPESGGYPMRAVRTHEYLYIRNFAPDRWPSGTPNDSLSFFNQGWYADVDGSPTKHLMVRNRNASEEDRNRFQLAFAKRPGEELYDLAVDPEQLRNVALDPAYAAAKRALHNELMQTLLDTGDPRTFGRGGFFDYQPYTGGTVRRPQE